MTNIFLAYSNIVGVILKVDGHEGPKVNNKPKNPQEQKYLSASIEAAASAIGFFFSESIWNSILISGFGIVLLSNGESSKNTCDEATKMSPVVNFFVGTWSNIEVHEDKE